MFWLVVLFILVIIVIGAFDPLTGVYIFMITVVPAVLLRVGYAIVKFAFFG